MRRVTAHRTSAVGSLGAAPLIPAAMRALGAKVVPHQGTPATVAGFEAHPGAHLGEGKMGGSVFRVSPRGAAPFVLKVYHRRGASMARQDAAALAVLGDALAGAGPQHAMRAVKHKGWHGDRDDAMLLEDTQGETLTAFAARLSDTEMRTFRAHVVSSLEALEKSMKRCATFRVGDETYALKDTRIFDFGNAREIPSLEMTATLPGPDALSIRFKIKPDNVLVTRAGQLVIIDPF